MTGVLIVGISLSIVFNARQSSYSLIATKRKLTDRPVILPLAVLMLAVLAMTIPVLVIFPRAHYLIMPLGGLFVGMALWPRVNSNTKRWVFASTTIVLLLFAAYTFEVARRSATGNAEPTPTASTARWMSDQESTSWRLLGLDWGWHIYVPNLTPLSTETLPQDDETFKQFLTRNRINAVIVTEALRRGAWSATSGFDEFMKNPASYGFERVVADSPVWVRASDVGFGNGQTTNIDN